MSTSTTPRQQSAKGPRRSGKKPRPSKNIDGSISDVGVPTEHQRNINPANINITKTNNKVQPSKASNANSRSQSEALSADRGKPSINQNDKSKATPIKAAAYAGATFQQSPAASALPLPSFYSKSMPAATSIPSQLTKTENFGSQSPLATVADDLPSMQDTNPCDFLFEAARQARATPRGESPATRSGNLSVSNASPAPRSPAPKDGESLFPFELEGGAVPGEDGGSFATPYKERIEALKSTRSTSLGGKSMDETERKAKSDALKNLLMKSSAQDNQNGAQNGAANGFDMNNPFNARAPYQQPSFMPQGSSLNRRTSGPSTTYMGEHPVYNSSPNLFQMAYQFPPPQSQTPKRPTSSRLRNVYGAQSEPEYAELSSDSAITPPISTSRKPTLQQAPQHSSASKGPSYPSQQQMPAHRPKPSAQQLEDDLRRVLKLDLTSRG